MSKNLDLYAKIEPYIGFYDEYDKLYDEYLKILKEYDVLSILDVGCGNGNMLKKLQDRGYRAEGIDLSQEMVSISQKKGVKASCKDIADVEGRYDAVIAVADVLNYIPKEFLKDFLKKVQERLKKGGVFLCDINTKFGFSEVADGVMVKDEDDIFLSIDALFDGETLDTHITLFEKKGELYRRSDAYIEQYYHDIDDIVNSTAMKFEDSRGISMFSDSSDKLLLGFINL